MRTRYAAVSLAFAALALNQGSSQEAVRPEVFQTLVDPDGSIRKPANFRENYVHLGAFMVHDPKGDEFHHTYASPGTAEAYRRTGKFPDGSVLVKEVTNSTHTSLTTGDAHWATDVKVWFVMIKDEKGRYPGNSLWGEGWGWALFDSKSPDEQIATDFRISCLGCHVPAQKTDWVYIQGYPLLRETLAE